jgi:hypothetical protein
MRPLLALLCVGCLLAVEWPARVGDDLELRGSGRFTWLWYKVYDVALWTPSGVTAAQVLDDRPRRIAFRYLRAFSAAELGKATTKTVNERIGTTPRAEIDAGVTAINALWPAVVVGDELILDYRPGSGTTVTHNAKELGTVTGSAFASVLFAVWLGSDPIDEDLRDALIGSQDNR